MGPTNDHAGGLDPATRPSGVAAMSHQSELDPPINAYGFVGHTVVPPADFVEAVLSVPGVRFAGRTIGSSVAVVAVHCHTLEQLQDEILPEVAAHGAANVAWTTAAARTPIVFNPPVKKGRTALGALVRIRTPHVAEVMAQLRERFEALNDDDDESRTGFHAAATRTYGAKADLLLDLGAPDEDSLFEQLERLDGLPAVTTYDVSLARWDDNATWGID